MFASRRPRRLSALVTSVAVIGALFTVIGSASGATASVAPAPIDRQVANAVGLTSAIVHVTPDATLAQGLRAARAAGAQTGTTYDAINVFVAYGMASTFERLSKSSVIGYIEANRTLHMFTDTSHKATRGQDVLDGAVTLPDGTRIDGTGVGVAVVDSGIDGTHPDLVTRMGGNVKIICSTPQPVVLAATGGFSQCKGPKQVVPLEDTDTPSAGGHGTHVAGIVAGTGAASSGKYHGAAPGATLYGVSVGTAISVENGLDGLNWVLENHDVVSPPIKVVNNSWGGSYSKYDPQNAPFHKALWQLQDALIADGVSVVFANGNASGNGTATTTSGECVNPTPGLICVANYDDRGTGTRNGTISTSSSRGKSDTPLEWPDISAPGTNITSTCRVTLPVCTAGSGQVTNDNNYRVLSGTSMAAPHIAGIVAQLYQADPTLTPAAVENILEDTAYKFQFGSAYGLYTDPTNPNNTSSFEKGHGLVDVVAALQSVLNPGAPGPEPTPTPTPTPSPTGGPTGPGTTYYFHSDSGLGNVDNLPAPVGAAPSFDTTAPTFADPSTYFDSIANNAAPTAHYDPHWTGTVSERIQRLDVKFWQRQVLGDTLGNSNWTVTVWVGSTGYELPEISKAASQSVGNATSLIEHTFTTMLDGTTEVPLNIDPAGEPVTISIGGTYVVDNGPGYIDYDSVGKPSSFTVNGNGSTGGSGQAMAV
ncbi:MAG: serine protease AprX [Actinomycetota bacterium]|jgi:serine protease AprX|nr:serine protease AprX [Actinomycetota bacterium]